MLDFHLIRKLCEIANSRKLPEALFFTASDLLYFQFVLFGYLKFNCSENATINAQSFSVICLKIKK